MIFLGKHGNILLIVKKVLAPLWLALQRKMQVEEYKISHLKELLKENLNNKYLQVTIKLTNLLMNMSNLKQIAIINGLESNIVLIILPNNSNSILLHNTFSNILHNSEKLFKMTKESLVSMNIAIINYRVNNLKLQIVKNYQKTIKSNMFIY